MRAISIAASLALIAAISSTALAGSPDEPGIAGKEGVSQAAQDFGSDWGHLVSGAAQAGTHLGPVVQDIKDGSGGSPNPANDKGGGND